MAGLRIAVLSAGNGGQALAGDLALQGHDVALYDLPAFQHIIQAISDNNSSITLRGKLNGTARIGQLSTNMQEALHERTLIYVTAPSFAQQEFFVRMLPHLTDGQCVLLMPGNYGCFGFKQALHQQGKRVLLAETDNLPYACAASAPGQVSVRGIKTKVSLAAYPATDTQRVVQHLEGNFSSQCTWVQAQNVLQTSMSSLNMVVHCAPMLANAARVESAVPFEFYYEGLSQAVCKLVEATDNERLEVAAAYGLKLPSAKSAFSQQYAVQGDSLFEIIQSNSAFAGKAPTSLKHRFLSEDAPFSLVPLVELGRAAQTPIPVMESLITLLQILTGEDYRGTGQTLSKMGFAGMHVEEILTAVHGVDHSAVQCPTLEKDIP